jgi:type I restriction enzyme S subunit
MKEVKLQKYPAYKNSGVEWLGEIPEHWDAVSLGSILELKSDKNHPDYEVLSVYREYGVIKKDSRDDNHNATSLDTSNYKAVEPGDLVVNKMKAWQGSMGVSPHKGIVSPAYITCRVNSEKIHPEYLHQLLRCDLYIGEYNRLSYGVRVGQWDMHYEDFKHITTTIPPIAEQTAIANFLDIKTAQIESAISIKQKQIELLKERRQILIHRAVTRGLNRNVKLKDSGVEWIGEIPEGWNIVPIRRLIDVRDGTHDTPLYVDNVYDTYPLVTSKDFEGDIINFTNTKRISKRDHLNIAKRSGVKSGDVLMSMIGGNIGKSVIIDKNDDFSVKNVALFITRDNYYLAKYLRYYFDSGLLNKQIELKSRGGAQGFLSLGDIRNLIFFKMPKSEMVDIVVYLDKIINQKISTAISLKEKEIEKLKEYKQVLINEVVTGKLKI